MRSMKGLLFLALTLFTCPSHSFPGQLHTSPTSLSNSYDFIVIGSGPSGLVVATRLTENPRISVLVIESGDYPAPGSEREFLDILLPTKYPTGPRSAPPLHYFWRTTTTPIDGLNGRSTIISTGKVVGGGSAMNAMAFGRASRRDFEDWAKLVGDEGWGWKSMKRYLNKAETFTPPDVEFVRKGNVSYHLPDHGHSGPISSSFPPQFFESHIPFLKAERELGVPQPRDQASGDIVGAVWVPVSVRPGEYVRSYVVNEYYRPVEARRRNLHLIYNSTVTRILFRGKTAVGVEFQKERGGEVTTVRTKREVVVAAGAVKSPQLLMVSGVGKKELLRQFGIPVVHDSPNVGEGFQDHANLPISYTATNPPEEDWWNLANRTFIDEQFQEYLTNKTGYYTTAFSNRMLLLSLPFIAPDTYKSLLSKYTERLSPAGTYLHPSAPPSYTRIYRHQRDLLLASLSTNDSAVDQGTSGRLKILLRPFSRGLLSISTASIFDEPVLNPRTFSHPLDAEIMLAAIRYNRKLLAHPHVKSSLNPIEVSPAPTDLSDKQLLAVMRARGSPTAGHPCCALGMGSVVDAKLRVVGLRGLRVVDSSAWPFVPGAHATQSTAYGFGEKAADLIKESL